MADLPQARVWRVFSTPKAGHNRAEYEDAFAANPHAGRFAIADGASESSFAGAWADLLVQGYTGNPGIWSRWLPHPRKSWHETFKERTLAWYAEEKFLEGAYATFLGLTFNDSHERWQAVAIGDCCLFHVREQRLIQAFPVRQSSAFGNQPDLLGSRRTSKKIKRVRVKGAWHPGDRMLLMTDALAQWFLQQRETQQEPWNAILALATQEEFETWMTRLRETKELRNDDVTLVVIQGKEFEPQSHREHRERTEERDIG